MSKTDYAHGILLCVLSFVSRLFEVREEEEEKKIFEILPYFAKA